MRKSLPEREQGEQTRGDAAASPRWYSSIGFVGWPQRPRQRVSASRWPLVGTLAQVWNIRLLHSGRPAVVYRRKALEWPSTGATREGEAVHPAHPGSTRPSLPPPKPPTVERSLRALPAAQAGQQGAAATGARRSYETALQYLVKSTRDNRTADIHADTTCHPVRTEQCGK